jgi:hypothetical protein
MMKPSREIKTRSKYAACLILLAVSWAARLPAAEPASPRAPGQPTADAAFDLVTASEAAAWNSTAPKELPDFKTRDLGEDNAAPTCHSTPDNDADNPQVRIVSPALGKTQTPPLDIDIQFVPTASAPIRPETFRVCYLGLVAMDITKRITDRVPVSEKGLRIGGARLPHGHHRLILLVADRRGRLGRREAVLDID